MARKRMFDMEIVDTDLFLDMPQSSQNLYFHLGMRADDDGFVSNPKKIIKIVGANDDDLKLLFLKKFIIPFESGVVVIRHWKLNNYLRKDRYTETIYKEEKRLLTEDENGVYNLGIPDVNQVATNGIHSIEENSIDKNSIEENSKEEEKGKIPYEEIVDLYHKYCLSFSKVMIINDSRKKVIGARYKEYKQDLSIFETLFKKAEESEFLKGNNDRGWKANFDWLINSTNMVKVLENNYANKKQGGNNNASTKYGDGSIYANLEC